PASLDVKKLVATFQERYMQRLPVADKVERVLPYLRRAGLIADPVTDAVRATVTQIVTEAGPRLVVAGAVPNFPDFFTGHDQLRPDDKALDKHVRKPGAELLRRLRDLVAAAEPFDAATLKARVEDYTQAAGVKPGPVSQTLRVAVTGKEVGFGTYETLAI